MKAIALGTLLVLALAVGREMRVRSMDHYVASQPYEDLYYVPPPNWLRVFSLGWDEALADLLWIRALIYFGDEIRARGRVRHALRYVDAIIALDPDFKRVYRWAGVAGMYKPQAVTVADMKAAIEFLERGVRRFPDDGSMAWDLGASLTYELAPLVQDPEEKRSVKARGLEFIQSAVRLGAGPDWMVLSNAAQLESLGRTEQAIRHLEEMYATVQDEDVRQQITLRLTKLRSAAHAEALAQARKQFEQRRQEDLPWVPEGLYLFLAEPRPDQAEQDSAKKARVPR